MSRSSRAAGKNRAATFVRFRAYGRTRGPNYVAVIMVITVRVSHRLLIPAAGISPVFMTADIGGAQRARRHSVACCAASARGGRIKSRKIENEKQRRAELPSSIARGKTGQEARERTAVESARARAQRWKREGPRVAVNLPRPCRVKFHLSLRSFFSLFSKCR